MTFSIVGRLQRTALSTRLRQTFSPTTTRQWSLFRAKPVSPSPSLDTQSQTQAQSRQKSVNASVSTGEVDKVDMQAHAERQLHRPKKTVAQLDEELRLAMEGKAGDGGESGVELEDGKAVSMKRGVRENMFRYI